MDIYNTSNANVQFCIYEPGDRLYWLSLYPGGAGRSALAAGGRFIWTGAGTRSAVQIVFFVNGVKIGPKLVTTSAVTINASNTIINAAPRAPTAKDLISHVVVLVLENRSFDNVLGWLYADSSNRPQRNVPASPAPTYDGLEVDRYWNTLTAASHDRPGEPRLYATRGVIDAPWYQQPNPNPREDYPSMLKQVFGTERPAAGSLPAMYGVAESYAQADPANPRRVMQCFGPDQLPVLSQLARSYAVCDRWFASLPCETWPNRSFIHAGTSFGRLNNGDQLFEDNDPVPNLTYYAGRRTVFDALDAHQISWKVYHDTLLGPSLVSTQFWTLQQKLTRAAAPLAAFEQAARAGTLPAYSFIEPEFMLGANDAHPGPGCDMRRTEDLLLRLYRALREGVHWNNTLWIITADEHGGCYDHVAPPATAVPPDNSAPQFDIPGFAPFCQYGPRVPTVVVSPLIEPGTVFRAPQGGSEFDHTSILSTLRDWLFRPDNGYPSVPADWLASARVAAAPSVWPLLTRSVPRTDRPAFTSSQPRPPMLAIAPSPTLRQPTPAAAAPTPAAITDAAAGEPLPQHNGLQVALAVEADALVQAGVLDPAANGSLPSAASWNRTLTESAARRAAALSRTGAPT